MKDMGQKEKVVGNHSAGPWKAGYSDIDGMCIMLYDKKLSPIVQWDDGGWIIEPRDALLIEKSPEMAEMLLHLYFIAKRKTLPADHVMEDLEKLLEHINMLAK